MTKQITPQKLLRLALASLVDYLEVEFGGEIPERIESIEEMRAASEIMLKLTNQYAYLLSVFSYAKLDAREKSATHQKRTMKIP